MRSRPIKHSTANRLRKLPGGAVGHGDAIDVYQRPDRSAPPGSLRSRFAVGSSAGEGNQGELLSAQPAAGAA